jgi:hypothetical protein
MARAELDLPRWHSRRVRIGALGVKTLLVLTGVGSPLWLSLKYSRQLEQHPPLYGIWDIDTFVRGRDTMPALLGDVVRWRRLVVSHPGFLSLHLLNDSTRGFGVNVDTLKGTLQWTSVRDSAVTGSFRYLRSGVFHDQLALDGVLNKDSLHVRLHRVDESRFLLVNRGYHWINEFPFNR